MISGKRSSLLIFLTLLFIVLPFVLMCYQFGEKPAYSHLQRVNSTESSVLYIFKKDSVINLLGKSFDEIKQVLGEPDEQGYSEWFGPHYYILYRHIPGFVIFCSSGPENKIAVSIILGSGQEVLGAKVGMPFAEIKTILGAPDFGPELGMDNLYYMDYFMGEIKNQTPEVFLSFIADDINSPTYEAFVKLESYGHGD